jgi:hypothetical protein
MWIKKIFWKILFGKNRCTKFDNHDFYKLIGKILIGWISKK